MNTKQEELSQKTINRLTQYHTILREYIKKSLTNITSAKISEIIGIDESQVRKDFKYLKNSGKCRVGYNIKLLKARASDIYHSTLAAASGDDIFAA